LDVLRSAGEPLTADELVARARKAQPVSSSDVLSAAWHLVVQGKASFTADHRLVMAH
jgi:hypothetical protein